MNHVPDAGRSVSPTETSQEALDQLVRLLDLEAIEVNIFRGVSTDENRQRVFGGQVAGQALVAAARTIDEPGRIVHSLHAYFLRPGDPTVPILYEVDRIRDGRSFTTRRVVAIQHGGRSSTCRPASTTRSRARPPARDARATRPTRVAARLPDPDGALRRAIGDWYDRPRPIDIRYVDRRPVRAEGNAPAASRSGCGPTGRCPTTPVLHACVVTYASDMTLLDTTLLPFGCSMGQPGRADGQPRSRDVVPPAVPRRRLAALRPDARLEPSSARGLAGGAIFTADGELVRQRRAGGPGPRGTRGSACTRRSTTDRRSRSRVARRMRRLSADDATPTTGAADPGATFAHRPRPDTAPTLRRRPSVDDAGPVAERRPADRLARNSRPRRRPRPCDRAAARSRGATVDGRRVRRAGRGAPPPLEPRSFVVEQGGRSSRSTIWRDRCSTSPI